MVRALSELPVNEPLTLLKSTPVNETKIILEKDVGKRISMNVSFGATLSILRVI